MNSNNTLAKISFNHPLTDDDAFKNRRDETTMLKNFYEAEAGKLAILVGDRRVGKTSLLLKFQRELRKDTAFILIPEGSLYNQNTNPEARLAKEVYDGLRRVLNLETGVMDDFFATGYDRNGFIALLSEITVSFPKKRFIFAFDEFDAWVTDTTRNRRERDALSDLINSMLQASHNGANRLPIQIILTVCKIPGHLQVDQRQYLRRIEPFSKEDLRILVEDNLSLEIEHIEEDDLEVLSALSGNWPWFTKFLLQCAFYENIKLSGGWPGIVLAIIRNKNYSDQTQSTISQLFDGINTVFEKQCSPYERGMIIAVSKLTKITAEQVATLDEGFRKALENLKGRKFICGDPTEGYILKVGLLSFWAEQQWDKLSLEFEELYSPQLPGLRQLIH